jgi:hypothetical protein
MMRPREKYLSAIAGVGLLALGITYMSGSPAHPSLVVPQANPATRPSPATTQSSDPLPAEFAILQTRNAFSHGPGTGGPGATLVFRGAVKTGPGVPGLVAFIEDMTAKSWVQAQVGTLVADGRIKSIDLDAIVYEVAGTERRIEVGQNLNGEAAPPPAPPATQPAPTSPTPQAPPQPPPQPGQ